MPETAETKDRKLAAELQPRIAGLVLTALDGRILRLNSLHGHPVLLDLWATWCEPCREEMPFIDKVFHTMQTCGLLVIGLDEDSDPTLAVRFMIHNEYDWPNYHEDPKTPVLPHTSIPLLLLIDSDGTIVYAHAGIGGHEGLAKSLGRMVNPTNISRSPNDLSQDLTKGATGCKLSDESPDTILVAMRTQDSLRSGNDGSCIHTSKERSQPMPDR